MFIREMSVNKEKYTQKENKDDISPLVPTHNPTQHISISF